MEKETIFDREYEFSKINSLIFINHNYDSDNNLIGTAVMESYPDPKTVKSEFEYDDNGNVVKHRIYDVSLTGPKNLKEAVTIRNKAGEPVDIISPDRAEKFLYHGDGSVTRIIKDSTHTIFVTTDSEGIEIHHLVLHDKDDEGNFVKEIISERITTKNVYDEFKETVTNVYTDGELTSVITRRYNNDGVEIYYSNEENNELVETAVDENGNVTSIKFSDATTGEILDVVTNIYDDKSRLLRTKSQSFPENNCEIKYYEEDGFDVEESVGLDTVVIKKTSDNIFIIDSRRLDDEARSLYSYFDKEKNFSYLKKNEKIEELSWTKNNRDRYYAEFTEDMDLITFGKVTGDNLGKENEVIREEMHMVVSYHDEFAQDILKHFMDDTGIIVSN